MSLRFAFPWAFISLALIPLIVYAFKRSGSKSSGAIRFSNKDLISGIKDSLRVKMRKKLIYLRALALLLLIFAAARPQSMLEETKRYVEGIDIVLAVDISTSMKAMDFELKGKKVDRLEALKSVVKNFIGKRFSDRIALVAFAGVAYTACPLTLDHDWLEHNLERVRIGMVEDGTAIGTAVMASLNRLKDSDSKEKVIILLTDGRNNAGRISPLVAAEVAKAMGVTVHTIGMGTEGMAPYPFQDRFGNVMLQPVEISIDEKLLKDIADKTGGVYFRGNDTASLEKIYAEIDRLEKTAIEETGYNIYKELFGYFLFPAMVLVLFEIFLANTFLRRIP
ncbi:MAG: VWA domain-containing protein [Candidatus Omnitrophota bacterium]